MKDPDLFQVVHTLFRAIRSLDRKVSDPTKTQIIIDLIKGIFHYTIRSFYVSPDAPLTILKKEKRSMMVMMAMISSKIDQPINKGGNRDYLKKLTDLVRVFHEITLMIT